MRMRILLLNRFAVSCVVWLERELTVIKVCLLLPFLLKICSLNATLALKTSKSFIQLVRFHSNWAFVSVCKFAKVFRVTPTLFDGDYFWHTKHAASESSIILLHFEWAFLT